MKTLKTVLLLLAYFISKIAISQGCSDAGFCTINSFKPTTKAISKNEIKIGLSSGNADYSIDIFGAYIDWTKKINNNTKLNFKVNAISQSGVESKNTGLSDFYATFSKKNKKNLGYTFGLKIPFTNGNQMQNGKPLPMDYQNSLGTFDFIVGLNYKISNLKLATALQIPIIQNKNSFSPILYPIDSRFRSFKSTNKYVRQGDLLLRLSYLLQVKKEKLSITPSLLPIYHLANDTYIADNGTRQKLIDSKGLTVNGVLYLNYEINSTNALELNIGKPFVTRKNRPDGLTRSFVATLEYSFKF